MRIGFFKDGESKTIRKLKDDGATNWILLFSRISNRIFCYRRGFARTQPYTVYNIIVTIELLEMPEQAVVISLTQSAFAEI